MGRHQAGPRAVSRVTQAPAGRSRAVRDAATAVRLRDMRHTDIPAVAELEAAEQPSPWSPESFASGLNAGYRSRLAWLDGEVAGYLISSRALGEAQLLNLCVAERCRRQGVASALLQEWMNASRAQGVGRLLLEVRVSNRAARALYRRFGFEQTGTRRGYYPAGEGAREDALLLERRIGISTR